MTEGSVCHFKTNFAEHSRRGENEYERERKKEALEG